ncbi:hypothetical protein [Shimia abyssi]|nr:hypothetical protein [Shimia abyssi]
MIWRLDLITLNSTLNVTGNVPAKGGYIDSGFTEFHGLVTALVEHFTTFKPDLKVVFGEHGRARTIMFIIGLFSALGGGGLFATALLGGVSSNRMTEAAIPFVALFILGGVLIRANHPWKAPTKIDVSLLPQLLTYLSGSSVNSEHWE